MAAGVELQGVSLRYPGGPFGVRGISLAAAPGEVVAVVGPSGSGKSTLLRLVAGLERPTEGRVRIGGRDVTDLPPGERDVAMVFQGYALYPHLTVAGNLAFPLRMRRVPRRERRRRVAAVAAMLGITELLPRRPATLSGGQRQRVAIGRAVVREPACFLLDEPLSNLDARLRERIRGELARLLARLATTTLYVTHDQVEAVALGHRVAVVCAGRLRQVGPPEALYRRPADCFVAAFLGSPGMNLVRAQVERGAEGVGLALGGARLAPPPGLAPRLRPGPVVLGFRPEAARPAATGLRAVVAAVEPLGHETVARLVLPGVAPVDPEAPERRLPGEAAAAIRLAA
ncbi:MAG: ABC transporter ATP-binding protein, partial [Nitrospirae bacterium]